jgi:type VI secretion system protein VasG
MRRNRTPKERVMPDINLETVAGKLNRVGYETFFQALRQAKRAGNRHVELAHWLGHILQGERTDIALTADHFKLDRGKLLADVGAVVGGFRTNETEMPAVSNTIIDALDRGWHYATLLFGESQIRTGHVLVGALQSRELARGFAAVSPEFAKIQVDVLMNQHRKIWSGSAEEGLRPMDGAQPSTSAAPGIRDAAPAGQTALDQYAEDLTAKAKAGGLDPVLGRDDEIRRIVDVLMRRRQNNPILTGEAGVGKTAVVEGLAQRIAAGDVPPPLRGVRLCALDVGLMQAGASMKGEFEQRLRSVIDAVQGSPIPVILFIDEAHTLIGAGGAAGTGDAANLLKPALARGTLRTIAATTWSEYRQYIEKDPALTRRFQPIQVGEPDVARCCDMLRGIVAAMEKHHKVRISDAAVVAAVNLSHRYIPARQLPDKAVSLLDTACARVAISQSGVPAAIDDVSAAIAARDKERAARLADGDLAAPEQDAVAALDADIAALKEKLAGLQAEWETEQKLVNEIRDLRDILAPRPDGGSKAGNGAAAPPPSPLPCSAGKAEIRAQLQEKLEALAGRAPEQRMLYAHVDEQVVAAVVSDWTGIPVGRMVKNEIENVLRLPEILNRRVVGQTHALAMIAKRIETSRARLDNPDKPIGVFLLSGPSGVGKTETALALAEALYGGEQNMITINMSEFQEAHTVSALKGAPPGYVGYGEGGRLTEAVRRRPYSVILLDEVEKAHPDVHEVFFQVFDKGFMDDGNGRRIDFKNTLIILTTNVGTDVIMEGAADSALRDDPEALARALRPELLQAFPAALLGRMVAIPYLPLSEEMLGGIVRLQLERIGRRIRDNHAVEFSYDPAVVDHIVAKCDDPNSGGRMIDNIITNTLLPALSREFLRRSLAAEELHQAKVGIENGDFAFAWV